jgi:branched-chain amino acid transport system ATP-binding protein
MGAYRKEALAVNRQTLDLVFSMFPILAERRNQKAGSLSGGQQQMVTIGRALMTRPRLVMMDEPSQGLAPKLIYEIFETIERLKKEVGLTILLVEQNAAVSLGKADYVYVMHEGLMKAEGTPAQIKASDEIREAYLGI